MKASNVFAGIDGIYLYSQDLITLAEHTPIVPPGELPKDDFKITIKGDTLTDKDNAGAAILEACKEVKNSDPVVSTD